MFKVSYLKKGHLFSKWHDPLKSDGYYIFNSEELSGNRKLFGYLPIKFDTEDLAKEKVLEILQWAKINREIANKTSEEIKRIQELNPNRIITNVRFHENEIYYSFKEKNGIKS